MAVRLLGWLRPRANRSSPTAEAWQRWSWRHPLCNGLCLKTLVVDRYSIAYSIQKKWTSNKTKKPSWIEFFGKATAHVFVEWSICSSKWVFPSGALGSHQTCSRRRAASWQRLLGRFVVLRKYFGPLGGLVYHGISFLYCMCIAEVVCVCVCVGFV